jgi:hypothetical protein
MTQDIRGEIYAKIEETQLGSQAVKKDLHEELDLRALRTKIDIQAINSLPETTRR